METNTKKCESPEMVEEQLSVVCHKLKETEVKIDMISRMVRNNVATNDVRNFVRKQSKMKRSSSNMNLKLSRIAMKSKLSDLCATANRLRRRKRELREKLRKVFFYPKSRTRQVVKNLMNEISNQTIHYERKMTEKYRNCELKMRTELNRDNIDGLPPEVKELISGVNVFKEKLVPEEVVDPMVCDSRIELNENELAFLKRGPSFMMRQPVSEIDFKTDIGKMIVKQRFDEGDRDREEEIDDELEERCKLIEAEAGLVYNKTSSVLDLGKLKATNYKYNNFIHLPAPGDPEKEACHEIRKKEMLRIFNDVVDRLNGGGKNKKGHGGGKRDVVDQRKKERDGGEKEPKIYKENKRYRIDSNM